MLPDAPERVSGGGREGALQPRALAMLPRCTRHSLGLQANHCKPGGFRQQKCRFRQLLRLEVRGRATLSLGLQVRVCPCPSPAFRERAGPPWLGALVLTWPECPRAHPLRCDLIFTNCTCDDLISALVHLRRQWARDVTTLFGKTQFDPQPHPRLACHSHGHAGGGAAAGWHLRAHKTTWIVVLLLTRWCIIPHTDNGTPAVPHPELNCGVPAHSREV